MFKIACICSKTPDLRGMIKRTLPLEQYQVEIVEAVLDEAVQSAHKYEQLGYDMIISRGITCKMIRQVVSIPVVMVETTYFDIISALYDASLYGSDMEYLHYRGDNPRPTDLNAMLRMLGLEPGRLHLHSFTTGEEVDRILQETLRADAVVLGTGRFVIERAAKRGFRTVVISSRREAFLNALHEAKQILEVVHKSGVRGQQLQVLIDNYCSGLILLDEHKKIEYATDQALRLLNLDRVDVMGFPFQDIFGKTMLRDIFRQKSCSLHASCGSVKAELQHLFWSGEGVGYAICLAFSTEDRRNPTQSEAPAKKSPLVAKYTLADMLGESAAIEQLKKKAGIYGMSDMTVLLYGESGTGKEILASSLHNASSRRNAPFVAVNCAALPQSLLESELFGYEDGAFTGAKRGGHPGLFEQANSGTIFLDEIYEIPLSGQAQLLRVLQEMTIRRVGGNQSIPLNVRVIAATNVDLWEQAQAGKFREDLFYRLNMLYLQLPPLRERKEDISLLFKAFVDRFRGDKGIRVNAGGIGWLQNYDWPGNVRELLSFSQKFAMLYDGVQDTTLLISELLEEFSLIRHTGDSGGNAAACADERYITIPVGRLSDMELSILRTLQKRYPNMRGQMALDLGISRTNLWKKLKELDKND